MHGLTTGEVSSETGFPVSVEVIDCAQQTVTVLNPSYKLQIQIHKDGSDYSFVDIAPKFESSHPGLCPITSFLITKVVNTETSSEVVGFAKFLMFGTEKTNVDSDEYWTHLILNDTS